LNIASLEKMIAAGRDSAMLRLTLARLLAQNGQWDAAAEHLQSALAQNPAYTAAWKELGQVRQAMGQNDIALAAWQKGVEVARSNGDKQAEKEMAVFLRRLLRAQEERGQSQVPE
jgi:tetratricopeptide (TPR) repeat protein